MCLARYGVLRWVNDGWDAVPNTRMRLSGSLWLESRAGWGELFRWYRKRHGCADNRIYAWRGDARFQPDGSAVDAFTPVEVC